MSWSQCASEPVSQCASEPVCQWASVPMSQRAGVPVSQCALSQCANEPVSQWASVPVSQCASESVCQWANVPVSQWASVLSKLVLIFVIPMLVGVLFLPLNDKYHNVYSSCFSPGLVTSYVSVHNSIAHCCSGGRSFLQGSAHSGHSICYRTVISTFWYLGRTGPHVRQFPG